ncbi:hypothetical protein L1887_10229 [Cichorium endivia]|nr:hypothetical protein L1887_10229 [Cichorium endivia]
MFSRNTNKSLAEACRSAYSDARYIFKNKAKSKLKSVADRRWSDGALELQAVVGVVQKVGEDVDDRCK